jgi:hypothetical protein
MTSPECQAIRERRELTAGIINLISIRDDDKAGLKGTEEELNRWFAILRGVVAEYRDGGDQMTEGCTCGHHE